MDKYEYQNQLNDFDYVENEDSYEFVYRNNAGEKTSFNLSKDKTDEEINSILSQLIERNHRINRLNSWLAENNSNGSFKISYCETVKDIDKSLVLGWSADRISIMIPNESVDKLGEYGDNFYESLDSDSYTNILDFMQRYFVGDNIRSLLEIDFDIKDTPFEILASVNYTKDELIQKLKSLSLKHGIVNATTYLLSRSLGILVQFNWIINYDDISINISIADNKIINIKDFSYIIDNKIFSSLVSLYKPSIDEIF